MHPFQNRQQQLHRKCIQEHTGHGWARASIPSRTSWSFVERTERSQCWLKWQKLLQLCQTDPISELQQLGAASILSQEGSLWRAGLLPGSDGLGCEQESGAVLKVGTTWFSLSVYVEKHCCVVCPEQNMLTHVSSAPPLLFTLNTSTQQASFSYPHNHIVLS